MTIKDALPPYVFTENGVAMLSGILNSERAISEHFHYENFYQD